MEAGGFNNHSMMNWRLEETNITGGGMIPRLEEVRTPTTVGG